MVRVGVVAMSRFLWWIPHPSILPLRSTSGTYVIFLDKCRVALFTGPVHAETGPPVGAARRLRMISFTVVGIIPIVVFIGHIPFLRETGTFLAARVLTVRTDLFTGKALLTAMTKAMDALADRLVHQIGPTPTVGKY